MSILKGPFDITIDGTRIKDVTDITYYDKKLYIEVLIGDFEQANKLVNTKRANFVIVKACSSSNIGATYRLSKFVSGVILKDNAVMCLKIVCDVWVVEFGEITV